MSMRDYVEFVKNCEAEGLPLHHYRCPHCNANIAALAPEPGDVWTAFVRCYACAAIHYRETDSEGVTLPNPNVRRRRRASQVQCGGAS